MSTSVDTAVPAPAPAAPSPSPSVHRLAGIGNATVICLAVCLAIDALVIGHAVVDTLMLNDAIADPASVSNDRLALSDHLNLIGGAAQALAFVVTAIVFLVWYGRAAANLRQWEIPRHGTAWSVISWFVPIMSWFVPKQVANDLWRAGDARAQHPFYVDVWWATWLVALLLSNVTFRIAPGDGADLTEFRSMNYAIVAAAVAGIVSGVLCIKLVRDVTRRHADRAAQPWTPPRPNPADEWVPQGGSFFNLEDGWRRTD